jgi:low affinity Fe/Cu permease
LRAHSSEPKTPLDWFERFARAASAMAGKPVAFLAALGIVIPVAGHRSGFRLQRYVAIDHQTGTTVVTFLIVFLLQHSQNRDTMALQLKLADLIIAIEGTDNKLATAEDLSEHELAELHVDYARKAEQTLKPLEAKRRSARETASRA